MKKTESSVGVTFSRIASVSRCVDTEGARMLIQDNFWIRARCDEILSDLIEGKEASLSSGDAVATALDVRYPKRVAAHLLDILSSVVNPCEQIGYREEEEV